LIEPDAQEFERRARSWPDHRDTAPDEIIITEEDVLVPQGHPIEANSIAPRLHGIPVFIAGGEHGFFPF
jgi:hypothetical protein